MEWSISLMSPVNLNYPPLLLGNCCLGWDNKYRWPLAIIEFGKDTKRTSLSGSSVSGLSSVYIRSRERLLN